MARRFYAYRRNLPGTHYLDALQKIPGSHPPFFCIRLKNKGSNTLAAFLRELRKEKRRNCSAEEENPMIRINAENLNDLAVVECKGRIVHSDAVFKMRDVVQAQVRARIIALDLSEVKAIGGAGLGMLVFLARWARQHNIQLKLFSPSPSVLEGLAQNRSIPNFEIATFHEMMEILAQADPDLHKLAA